MIRAFLVAETALAGTAATMYGAVVASNGGHLNEQTLVPLGVLCGGVAATALAAWKVATFVSRLQGDIKHLNQKCEEFSVEMRHLREMHNRDVTELGRGGYTYPHEGD